MPSRRLYHFTSPDRIEDIIREGIIYGDVPTSPEGGFNAAWLTSDKNPANQGWTQGGGKARARLTVDIPEEAVEQSLWKWLDLAKEANVEKWWLEILNATGGGGQRRWYVFLGIIEPEWISRWEIV
jgi:hypothetical protein